MISIRELSAYLDDLLEIHNFSGDASNNGLQLEAQTDVKKVAFAVDACQAVFDRAYEEHADFLFVHHGLSWGGNFKRITGLDAQRLRSLFKNKLSLYAAHLPLDAHPQYGHNAQMAQALGLQNVTSFANYAGTNIGFYGYLPEPVTLSELTETLNEQLDTHCHVVPRSALRRSRKIQTLGIVSGGAADCIYDAAALNLDAFLTGEFAHQHLHVIKELGVPLIAGGHYRTEVPGVKAVMQRVQEDLELECVFIDMPTGL